jgi:prolipoprotein diacylglyceryl transferase
VPTVLPILASIPSPSDNAIKIGGLELRAYGLAIALGVIAAIWISRRRWAARGGDPDDISRIALWAVLAGLIGARLYHVITDHDRFEGRWLHAFAVWEGGLGIPGGLIAGVGVGAYVAHRRGLPVAQLLDVVAPALPVAQAIGRLGNWFNQELFGRPTDLPWGLEIDPAHRPAGYLNVTTFHPTFLYEALWNLALAGGLVLWERHHPNSRPGRLFALYVAGYAVGRAWVEALRIDPATRLFGVRWNIWMSLIAFVGAVGWLVFDSWRARREAGREPDEAAAATEEVEAAGASTDTSDVATADEPESGADEEPAPDEAHASGEQPATGAASEGEPAAGDRTGSTAESGPEDQEAEPGADEPAPTEGAADSAEQPDVAESAHAPEQPDVAESGESAEQPDVAESGDAAEQRDVAESAAGGETAERSDATERADTTEKADAVGSATDASDAADEPTTPAANDPEADGASGAAPDASEPTEAEASHHTNPEPAPGAPAETADEEAAT